jgi:hypothetical protein
MNSQKMPDWALAILLCVSLAVVECSGSPVNGRVLNVSNSSNDTMHNGSNNSSSPKNTTSATVDLDVACSVQDTLIGVLPILFCCGLAYLGLLSGCTFAPKKQERREAPTSATLSPSQPMQTAPIPRQIEMQSTMPAALVFKTNPRFEHMPEQGQRTAKSAAASLPLPSGWEACTDQVTGRTYYQCHSTHITQWEHPAQSVGVSGSSFGFETNFNVMQNRLLTQSLGSTQVATPGQTARSNLPLVLHPELDEEATRNDIYWGGFMVLFNLGQRLIFIIPKVLAGGSNYELWLYAFDFVLLCYFAAQQQYCPGCLYNNVHVLRTNRKLKAIFYSPQSRFSGTKKLIVGVGSTSTVVQVVESVSDVWCFFKGSAGPWNKQSPKVVADNILKVAGILFNLPQSIVALVAVYIFWGFAFLTYFRSLPLSAPLCPSLPPVLYKFHTKPSPPAF